jgi:hypothetical protein
MPEPPAEPGLRRAQGSSTSGLRLPPGLLRESPVLEFGGLTPAKGVRGQGLPQSLRSFAMT